MFRATWTLPSSGGSLLLPADASFIRGFTVSTHPSSEHPVVLLTGGSPVSAILQLAGLAFPAQRLR